MSVIKVTEDNFNEVVNSDKPVLIDFWASWCGPCKMLSPIVDEFANEHDEYVVGKVNVDEEINLATNFQVMSIPTLLVFKNGKLANKSVGLVSKDRILNLMK